MMPKHIQIQAALYLGCRRISCFSYSRPVLFANTTELDEEFLTFYKPSIINKLQKRNVQCDDVLVPEVKGEQINIAHLPSFTRLCINVIVIPEPKSCKVLNADKIVEAKQKDPLSLKTRRYKFV